MADATDTHQPFQWGASSIAWTPEGYLLRVPAYLDARAVSLIDDASFLMSIPGAKVEYELEPAVWTKTGNGTSVEPGELRIRWPELPDAAGEAIREPLDRAASKALREAERATEEDTSTVNSLLRQLRGEKL
jgi:hypothetical protein